jgi:outer membrane lipoprotein-sorting protein
MKKLFVILSLVFLNVAFAQAQTAKQVLDKCAATLNTNEGLQADFTMSSAQYSPVSGTISIKGRMFHATTPVAAMWFDGKTQWTYMKNNDEVNISTPNESQLQALNPYNFIYMYKQGYAFSMSTSGNSYVVTLKGKDKGVSEMVITIHKQTYVPTQIRMLQNKQWTTIKVSNFRTAKLSDSIFRFNPKSYPNAEVIDLR